MKLKVKKIAVSFFCAILFGCGEPSTAIDEPPANKFDMSHWVLTVPLDDNNDGVSDIYNLPALQTYSHSDFFYLDQNNHLVFASSNRAATERTSTNTRSELHYLSPGIDESAENNGFVLADHKQPDKFESIGRKLEATLHVDHVAKHAGYPNKPPAYSVVIGQVHAVRLKEQYAGIGWGNEPLKISYKKWPNHQKGSVYWTYERNLATDDPNRTDIAYSVWGRNWDDPTDPGDDGIALGEEFSYSVNIYKNTMYLVFTNEKQGTVYHQINLADNKDANGNVDEADYPLGYAKESLYFKAGAYNQCSTKDVKLSFRYPACSGTGDWDTDVANGDYTKVTFSKLMLSAATPK